MNIIAFVLLLALVALVLLLKRVLIFVGRLRRYILPDRNTHSGKRMPRVWKS